MKKQFFIITTIIAFLTILTAPSVSAQTGKTAKINVKFDFHVGKKVYPAGEYIVESVSRTSDNVLQIRSASKGKNQLIISNITNAGKIQQPKLVFQRQGENYFLSKVFLESSQWGFSLLAAGKQQKNLSSAETVEALATR